MNIKFTLLLWLIGAFANQASVMSVPKKPASILEIKKAQEEFTDFKSKIKDIAKCSYERKGLLIFLDDSKEKDQADAIFGPLQLAALDKEEGPIIASASLLSWNDVLNEFKSSGKYRGRWIVKEISDNNIYLLIPHTYLNKIGIDINLVKSYTPMGSISPVELQLGLKVNHMKTVDLATINKIALGLNRDKDRKNAGYFIEALYDTDKKTSDIFCMRSDYQGKTVLPVWSFYLLGHGTMKESTGGGTLAHITVNDFKKVLNFLDHKINTRLLVYSSCYGAGTNAEIIYKDSMSAIQKTYSFAIITEAITDAPTEGKASAFDFNIFLKEVTTFGPIDYKKAIESVCLYTKDTYDPLTKKLGERRLWGNVPQIKLPGLEWFSVMESQKDIAQIGSILAQARDPQKPLNIVKFFNADPKGLLLYAAEIPFELIINSVNMDAIISMIPGDALHKIKKISSNRKTEDVIDWFMKIELLDPLKIFFIEEVNDIKNVLVYNKKISSLPLKHDLYAFFEKNGALYIKEPGKAPDVCTQDQKKKYNNLLKRVHEKVEMQEKIDQLGAVTLQTVEEVNLLSSLSGLCSIEKIENDAVDIAYIATYLFSHIKNIETAWIKEIKSMRGDIHILGGDHSDVVSVKDFIIDRKQKKCFFTYDNKFYYEEALFESFYGSYSEINDDYRREYIPRIVAAQEERKHRKLSKVTAESLTKMKTDLMKRFVKAAPKDQLQIKLASLKKNLSKLKKKLEALKKGLTQLTGALKKKPAVI